MSVLEEWAKDIPVARSLAVGSSLSRVLRQALPLTLVLGVGLAVRLISLNALGYNSDEAVYAGQGAAIAQAPVYRDIFPVFRAHPLLFQFTLALFFTFGVSDIVGRVLSVAFGLATLFPVYHLGRRLYGQRAGLIAALIVALMPYHVVVTRQVLLDGPMVFFSTLALYLLARFAASQRPGWLYAVGAAMGLTFLSKETGIIMMGAIYAFLALSPEVRVRIRDILLSGLILLVTMAPFPLSVALAGGGSQSSAQNYFVWQLFRRPNHTWDFYLREVPAAMGLLVVASALLGLWLLRRHHGWREKLLLLWIAVPAAFFQLWPTKGFQYLLPLAPAVAVLAGRTLALWPERAWQRGRWPVPAFLPGLIIALLLSATLFFSTWARIHPSASDTFLAGSGGVPGGREAGHWILENVPDGATFMTIGPSMANIVKFYGHRQAFGLSVSPNPLHRNPSYEPVRNPDFQIRTGEMQYLVWDSFSAGRSDFFSQKLLWYAGKYHGRAVHTETVTVTTPGGESVEKPVIIIYEVHP